jgi:flagellar biosynthesis/type III secretory pathway ATPase
MNTLSPLAPFFDRLDRGSTLRWRGRVLQVVGNLIESEGPFCSIGESCEITGASGKKYSGEVIGFRGSTMLSMAVENPQGIRFGDRIVAWGTRPSLRVGMELLGRVIDATGAPLDSKGEYRGERAVWAHPRGSRMWHPCTRWICHLRSRSAHRNLWWKWRRQKYALGDDGSRHKR